MSSPGLQIHKTKMHKNKKEFASKSDKMCNEEVFDVIEHLLNDVIEIYDDNDCEIIL